MAVRRSVWPFRGSCLEAAMPRFQPPLVKPCGRFSRARLSVPDTLSYSAWNCRAGRAFAARCSARRSRRAASTAALACSASTGAYPLRARRPSAAPPLRRGSVVHGIGSTLGRSALARFAGTPLIGLVAPGPPPGAVPQGSHGRGGDGPLLFPRRLSHRSAPFVRRGVLGGGISKRFTPAMAFARPIQARLPVAPLRAVLSARQASLHAADQRFAPSDGRPPRARPRASTPRSRATPAGCYEGGSVPPLAGLPPASRRQLPGRTSGSNLRARPFACASGGCHGRKRGASGSPEAE